MTKRFLFIVQGEGRGHLTQAITLSAILRQAGHAVVAVAVGRSAERTVPTFFHDRVQAPVVSFESPNFVFDEQSKSVKIRRTIRQGLRRSRVYLQSVKSLHLLIEQHQPDAVVNFYDLLGGLYYFLYRPNIPYVCVGHQYLLEHPDFAPPEWVWVGKQAVSVNTWFSCFAADKKLALSFRPMRDVPEDRLVVVPPLLRQEVTSPAPTPGESLESTTQPYFLAYMNQNGFAEEVIAWHAQYPEVTIHCYWDKKDAAETETVGPNLTFHRINDQQFLAMMHGCSGYVCTAGFESVCEAMYLGKPVMMIPVHGHYEQACNALDARQARAGISADRFDFSRFLDFLPHYERPQADFQAWQARAASLFRRELEGVCTAKSKKSYTFAFRYTGMLVRWLALD